MIAIGIDPGLTGAVAAVDTATGRAVVADLPMVEDAKGTRLDGRAFILLLRDLAPAGGGGATVGLELVRALPGFGLQSQESMVGVAYAVAACLDVFRAPVHMMTPQAWKKRFALARKKAEKPAAWKARHLDLARRLYPACEGLEKAKDHNRAEALLIAHHIALEVAG